MRCQLKPDHTGPHQERYNAGDESFPNWVTVTWEQDESILCVKHGRQRMDMPCEEDPTAPACSQCSYERMMEEDDDADGCEDS